MSIRHPYLTELVDLNPSEECVATRLRGTVKPGQMNRDFELRFKRPWFYREQRYSRRAMVEYSLVVALCVFGFGMLATSVVSRIRKKPRLLLWAIPWLLLISLAGQAGAYGYLTFTGKEGRETSEKATAIYENRTGLRMVLLEAEILADPDAMDPAWVRQAISNGWKDIFRDETEMTPIPRELDAPGQYTIGKAQEGLKVFTYDHAGGKHLVWEQGVDKEALERAR